jgi:hypothetical protein
VCEKRPLIGFLVHLEAAERADARHFRQLQLANPLHPIEQELPERRFLVSVDAAHHRRRLLANG